jgi:hypothetical protein
MTNKHIALGRKLYALSQQGVGGEKVNAQEMLDAFLEKHGLTITDVEPSVRTRRIFKGVNNEIFQMFINLAASIKGKDHDVRSCNGRGMRAIDLNDAEFADFTEKWGVYRKELNRELQRKKKEQRKEQKLLVHAFISKHNLYSKDGSKSENTELTAEDL